MRNRPQCQRSAFSVLRVLSQAHSAQLRTETAAENVCIP